MTAQIMTHTRFATQPVEQQPRRGRLPKAVPSVLIYGRDKAVKAYCDNAAQTRVNELRGGLAAAERVVTAMRYELSAAVQQTNAGRA